MTERILATNKNVVATPHAIAGDAGYTLRFASGRTIWVPAAVYELDFDGLAQPDLSLPENAPVPTSVFPSPTATTGYNQPPGPLTSPPKPD
jgi:hypothetical protein